MSKKTFGKYEVVGSLGRGGMAEVYHARDPVLDRDVAIKVIHPHLALDKEFEDRFLREAKLIASLRHSNIVQIFDFAIEDGQPFMVMEFLNGGTLKERIDRLRTQGRMIPLNEITSILTPIANALDYAHKLGAVHRDIKPANILFTSNGEPVLSDFGIAKILGDTGQITVTGGIIGSPKYMSPEQAASKPADKYSDIYSLCVVLYEMATNRTPFQGDSVTAVLMQHLKDPPPPAREFNPNIPMPVQMVIHKGLAKSPEERFRSASELMESYEASLRGDAPIQISQDAETLVDVPRESVIQSEATVIDSISTSMDHVPEYPPSSLPGAPISRKLPRNLAAIGILVIIVILSLIGLNFRNLIGNDQDAISSEQAVRFTHTPEISPKLASTSGTAFDISETPSTGLISEDNEWTSWTAANTIFAIITRGNEVIAGTWGGVTFWDTDTGEYRRFTTGDGLADPWVYSLYVDSDDSLWIGTADGLHHIFGDNNTYYDDDSGLDSTYITAIASFDDMLIAGTEGASVDGGGLNLFDGRSWKPFDDFPSKQEDPTALSTDVSSIVVDREGILWVGTTNGIGRFDGDTWIQFHATTGDLPDNYVNVLYLDGGGQLWAGTDLGVAKFNGVSFEALDIPVSFAVYGIVQDLDGGCWFSGVDGIIYYNPVDGSWKLFDEEAEGLSSDMFYCATRDEDGALYFGSDGSGIVRVADGEFSYLFFPNLPSIGSFVRIVPEPGGNLIFVEEWGVDSDYFELTSETWTPLEEIFPCCITPFAFDTQGNLWGSWYAEPGLWMMKPDKAWTNWRIEDGIPSGEVTAIVFGEGNLVWAGTDAGVAVLDLGVNSIVDVFDSTSAGFEDNHVNTLLHASDGSMWVGTDISLNRLMPDGNWEHFVHGDPFSEDMWRITDLAEDEDGSIWVTTSGAGVYLYSGNTWAHYEPDHPGVELLSYDVQSVTIAADGSVWFGTSYGGASVYREGRWYSIGLDDGLISLVVNDIYIDENNIVWFATSGGISRYIP